MKKEENNHFIHPCGEIHISLNLTHPHNVSPSCCYSSWIHCFHVHIWSRIITNLPVREEAWPVSATVDWDHSKWRFTHRISLQYSNCSSADIWTLPSSVRRNQFIVLHFNLAVRAKAPYCVSVQGGKQLDMKYQHFTFTVTGITMNCCPFHPHWCPTGINCIETADDHF